MSSLAFNRNPEEIRLRRVPWNQAMATKCTYTTGSQILMEDADLLTSSRYERVL
jgi:hypothetical protein